MEYCMYGNIVVYGTEIGTEIVIDSYPKISSIPLAYR